MQFRSGYRHFRLETWQCMQMRLQASAAYAVTALALPGPVQRDESLLLHLALHRILQHAQVRQQRTRQNLLPSFGSLLLRTLRPPGMQLFADNVCVCVHLCMCTSVYVYICERFQGCQLIEHNDRT